MEMARFSVAIQLFISWLYRFLAAPCFMERPLKDSRTHKSLFLPSLCAQMHAYPAVTPKGLRGIVKRLAPAASVPSACLCSSVQGLSCIRPPKKQHMSVCLIPFTPAVWPGALQRVDFLSSMPLSSLWGNASVRCQVKYKPAGAAA